jgi:hypothetical protein
LRIKIKRGVKKEEKKERECIRQRENSLKI